MTDIFLSVVELAVVSAIITVLLLIFEKLILKRFSPKLYYFAWLILALRMLLPFSLPQIETPVSVTIPNRTVSVSESVPEEIEYFDSVPQPPVDKSDMVVVIPDEPFVFYPIEPVPEKSTSVVWTSEIIANIWLTGVAIVALYYILQYAVFRIRLRKRVSVSDENITSVFSDVCSEMNIKNASLGRWSEARGPMLVGYIHPIIVLPSNIDYDEQALRFIFTHELTHFKRRDLWYKLLMSAVTAIYWFDPFAWVMRNSSYKSVELSCDCDVVDNKSTEYRGLYSKAILSGVALKRNSSQGYTTYFANDKRLLKERFSFIFDMSAKKLGVTILSLVIIASVVVSSVVACDFYEPEKPEEIENEEIIDPSPSVEAPEDIPEPSPDETVEETNAITAFSIVCDKDWNYSIAGIFENGNVETVFSFGEKAILDIDVDNGRLYILFIDEIGYIDLTADRYEYTHLFYSDTYEGYNSFYRFAVHKDYIFLLYGVYDVGDVYIDCISVNAESMNEVERYLDCMLMDDIYIDKENDIFYYYVVESNGPSQETTSVYTLDMITKQHTCILSKADMFRYFDGNVFSPSLVDDYIVYTFNKDGGGTFLCLKNLSTDMDSVINTDIKSYAISGKYIYYVDSDGVLSAFDLENDKIIKNLATPDQFNDQKVTIEPFGLEKVLVWALTYDENWNIKDSIYKIIDSEGNITDYDEYRSSSYPVYVVEPIIPASSVDINIHDAHIDFEGKRFTVLFENIASYIGKGIFDGNSMTDEDKFFLAYLFGECDGSNSEYGDLYTLDYIQYLLSSHISEDYASRFDPKNVSFYNISTMTFKFPTDFERIFVSEAKASRYDGIINVYRYNSDGSNLERHYIASLSPYYEEDGSLSWRIDSYYEKLTETSPDLDVWGEKYFDIAVHGYGDRYKDYEYVEIIPDTPPSGTNVVIGHAHGDYIAFELFYGENGVGIVNAELVDAEDYGYPEPIDPVTDEELSLDDIEEFERYIIQAFREGDHNLLNLLMGEQKYHSLPADPSISVATDTGYTELNIQIGKNGYLYSRKLIDSASFNVLNYTESLAYCVEKANDRFYLRSFGIYVEPNVVYFDVENYISFPGTDKIPFTVSAESWKTCSNLNLFAEAIRVAIKNGDWNLIAEMGAGYSNEQQNGVTTIIPSLKIYREISSVVCSYVGGNEYRYDIETTDGQKETLYIVISKDYDGNNTLSVNRSSSYVAPVPVPIEPATEEIYDSDIAELFEKLHLYQKYAEYSSASMKVDSSVTDESGLYNKVIDEKYDTWDEWTAFVSSVFCGNYLTNTKNNDLYINVDGYTYCMQGGMGWYLSEEYTYNIVENNNSEVVIDITYKENSPTVGEEETYQTFRYLLNLTENGWRIADQLPT